MSADRTEDEAKALAPLVSPEEALALAEQGAVLLDVRGPAAHARDGVLDGAVPVDRMTLDADFALDADSRLGDVDGGTPVVVACGTVFGSGPVAARLAEMGYRNVVHVDGGVPAIRAITEDTP